MISVLLHHEDEFDSFLFANTSSAVDMGRPAARAYTITFLINCFWASGLLRQDSHLREIMLLATSLALPQQLARVCVKYLRARRRPLVAAPKQDNNVTHARQDRCGMDVDYAGPLRPLLAARRLAIPPSGRKPPRGRDYEMIVFNLVQHSNFQALLRDIMELESFRTMSKNQRLENYDREATLMAQITDAIEWHVAPIACLGRGWGSLALKLRAVLHAFGLMSHDRKMLSQILASCVQFISDYGTEIGIQSCASCCHSRRPAIYVRV